jgi:site-specific recombinase XerD
MEIQVSAFLASLQAQPAYSDSTRLAYANDMRVFLTHLKKNLRRTPELADFNQVQIAGFLKFESQRGRRLNTLLRRRATLRRFHAFLSQTDNLSIELSELDWEGIDQSLAGLNPPRPVKCLTDGQISELLSVMEASPRPRARRDQAILLLLLETGLSVGALTTLNIADFDPSKGNLRVVLDDHGDRWVPLGESAEALARYLKEARPELNTHTEEQAFFISQMDGRMSRQGIWQILRHWGWRHEPPILLSPRLVRHTAALRMARADRPLQEIQSLMGHSNPLSTQALIRRLEAACEDQPTSIAGKPIQVGANE